MDSIASSKEIIIESDILHTADHPFCQDMSCGCHEDQEALEQVSQAVEDGEMTVEEADLFYRGRTL